MAGVMGKPSAEMVLAQTDKSIIAQKKLSDQAKVELDKLAKLKGPVGPNASKSREAARKKWQAQKDAADKELQRLTPIRQQQQNQVFINRGDWEKLLSTSSGGIRDAFAGMKGMLDSYGLGSLADDIWKYAQEGYNQNTVTPMLEQTPEWKKRFAGNELLRKAGLPVLDAGHYLQVETDMKDVMRRSGLPAGFYDTNADIAQFIGNNVGVKELQDRADLATQAVVLANPEYRKALNKMGIDDAHMAAYFLDKDRALPLVQKAAATAAVGAAAIEQNLNFDQEYAARLAARGVTGQQAQQGYQQVGQELESMSNLGKISGEQYGQREAEEAILGGNAQAANKRQRLLSQERGRFGGATGGGAAAGGLGNLTRRNT